MKNAIILHGKPNKKEYYDPKLPSASNCHWIPWLQKQLIINEIAVQTPEIPYAYKPNYLTWKKEFERYDIASETILIGHSCGGGFLVRWLSEHEEASVEKLILVAPWLDPGRKYTTDFFDFEIDSQLSQRIKKTVIINSDNDGVDIQKSIEIIKSKIPNHQYKEFHNYGHFTFNDMKTSEFPELLKMVLE